jgi:S1-C subfamily serine protease
VLVAARVGSEGAVSDLMPGDVIYSLNNRRVATLGDLRIALAGMKPGDAVVLQVERGGELIFLPFEADW